MHKQIDDLVVVVMQLRCLQSTEELRQAAPQWDDLWQRSSARLPTARAQQLALWLDTFAPQAPFQAWVVEQQGRFLAALPLVARCWRKTIRLAGLPSNFWSSSGELLLEPGETAQAAAEMLVEAFDQLPWPLLRLELVNVSAPAWQCLFAACHRLGCDVYRRPLYRIGQVEIGHNWPDYLRALSAAHRRQMRVRLARLEQLATLRLSIETQFAGDSLDLALRRGFEVEDRSWKGSAGSSVLRTPGMLDFYQRQAAELHTAGLLQIITLQADDRPIAFEYGWSAKGSYFSPKVGYDPAFAAYSPGQLLRYRALEAFHADPQRHCFDFLGPLGEAMSKWATHTYPIDRVLIAPRHRWTRTLVGFWNGPRKIPTGTLPASDTPTLTRVGSRLIARKSDPVVPATPAQLPLNS